MRLKDKEVFFLINYTDDCYLSSHFNLKSQADEVLSVRASVMYYFLS